MYLVSSINIENRANGRRPGTTGVREIESAMRRQCNVVRRTQRVAVTFPIGIAEDRGIRIQVEHGAFNTEQMRTVGQHFVAVGILYLQPRRPLAKLVCVGAVVATNRLIYPAAVGSDIGCRMAALAFDGDASLIDNQRSSAQILAGLYEFVPSNRQAKPCGLPVHLRELSLSSTRLQKTSQRDGCVQVGTLGRGNYFSRICHAGGPCVKRLSS